MRSLKVVLILCLTALGVPRCLSAQVGFLEGLFKNLDDIGAFWVYQGFLPHSNTLNAGRGSKQSGIQGPGLGFTFHMADAPPYRCRRRMRPRDMQPEPDSEARDSMRALRADRCVRQDSIAAWRFEAALIYSQVSGFHSQNTTYDLRFSVRELPRLALFALWQPGRRFSPYFGVHLGLLQLQSAAVFDSTGAYYPFGGNSYEVGFAVGGAVLLWAGSEAVQLFVEPGYTVRSFSNLDWGGTTKTVPGRFPHSLSLSGWEVAVGLEVNIPHARPEDASRAPKGRGEN